jgi:hypothetical protein
MDAQVAESLHGDREIVSLLHEGLSAAYSPRSGSAARICSARSCVEMVFNAIPEMWKGQRHPLGEVTQELNRHFVLHGTGVGWDGAQNATRAVLLLAATARTFSVLFGEH